MTLAMRHTIRSGPHRRDLTIALGATFAALSPASTFAHTSDAVAPADLLHAWQPDPLVVFAVLLAGWLYARGAGHLGRVASASNRPHPLPATRRAAFWLGLATILLALASPLDTATATVFTAHMVQHVLLIALAPPLLLLGRPLPAMLAGIPRAWRKPLATLPRRVPALAWLTAPAVAFALHTAALWLWHEPALYQAAVRHAGVHFLEHATFFLTALLFWWTLIPTSPASRRIGPAMAILVLFAMGMQGAALGVILTFWPHVLYPIYAGRSELWGLSAASDQRLAGLTMWIPAGSVYVIAAVTMVGALLAPDNAPTPTRTSIVPSGSPGS